MLSRTRHIIRALLHLGDRFGALTRRTRRSLGLLPCTKHHVHESCQHCTSEDKCRLHRVMLVVREETALILHNIRLADNVPAGLEFEQAA